MSRIKKRLVLTRVDGSIIRIQRRRRPASRRTTFDTAPELPSELELDAPVATAEQPAAGSDSPVMAANSPSDQPITEANGTAETTDTGTKTTEATPTTTEATTPAPQVTSQTAQVTSATAEASSRTAETTPQTAVTAETGAPPATAATRPEPQAVELAAPAEPPPGFAPSLQFRDGQGVRGLRTTGLFAVPDDSIIQLVLLLSSFAEQDQTANVWVRRVEDGELRTVFFRSLSVPAGGVQQLSVDGLGGQTIRVDVELSSDLLVPTASVTQYFLADGAILVRAYKSPSDFVPI
ncbi:MAG: hypothetical protein BAA04_01105 [Firmicutes bacterium ZCTH02-B6]|nr:MAG: hypothetical protein BAA04_01105 [Firmicutes bacterium ZCTH02-B6]